jgi:hypothetical protein
MGPFNFSTKITDVDFFGTGDSAAVKLTLAGKLRGDIWAVGVPTYNAATREFALRDVRLSAASESFLTRFAFMAGRDAIVRAVTQAGTVKLGGTIDSLKAKLDSIGDQDFDGAGLKIAVHELTAIGVFRLPEGFAALLDLRGVARLTGMSP